MELTRACTTTPPLEVVESADFKFYRMTTFTAKLTFREPDQSGLDISNMIVEFNVVETDGTVVLNLSSNTVTSNGSTITILDALNGVAEIRITDEETTSLTVGTLKWWMTLNPLNGDKLPRGKGSIFVINPY